MQNLFDTLTNFKGDAYEFEERISDLLLMEVFGNLYAIYPDRSEARKAILYILYVYSKDSFLLLSNEALIKIKQRAAEKVKLSEEMRKELVEFEFRYITKATGRKAVRSANKEEVEAISEEDGIEELEAIEHNIERIITTINKFLDYQEDKVFAHIMRKKDLYDQLAVASHRMIKKGNEVDWKQKIECNRNADELYNEIEEWERRMKGDNSKIRVQREEVVELERTVLTSIRPESVIRPNK